MKFVKTITLLMTFCVMAFGNMDRINALGGNPGFWPEDDANVSAFPAMVNNLDIVQASGAGNSTGSATVVWGEGTTWGFGFDGANDNDNNDWLNLMWGNGTYGTTFALGTSTKKMGDSETSSMAFGVGFGMNMDFGELGVTFDMGNSDNGTCTDCPDEMLLGFNLRRAQDLWLFDNLLATFNYGASNNLEVADVVLEGSEMTMMDLDVNLFTSLPTGSGVTAHFGLGFGFDQGSTKASSEADAVESTVITLPSATLGVEAEVTDWADVRFGLNHAYVLSGSWGEDFEWSGASTPDPERTYA